MRSKARWWHRRAWHRRGDRGGRYFAALHYGRSWHSASFQARLKLVEVQPEADLAGDAFLPSSVVGRYRGRDWDVSRHGAEGQHR